MTGSASEIVLIPYDQAYEAGFEDMPRRVPDLGKIRRARRLHADARARRDPARVIAHTRRRSSPPPAPIGDNRRQWPSRDAPDPSPSGCSLANAKPVRKLLLATGRDRAPHLPDIVQIESTNLCNAKCVFCPRDEMHRRQGVMDMELFKKIVDECADARHHARARPQLRRAVPRSAARREGPVREAEGHRRSRDDQQRLADHRGDRARDDRGRARRDQHQRGRRRQGSVRAARACNLDYDKVIGNIRTLARLRKEIGPDASEADPVVRPAEQLRRRAGVHRASGAPSPTRSTSPICTTGPAR